ncbi:MAG: hypothetical protein ACYDAJ_02640 [Nitrosotalea sp.]
MATLSIPSFSNPTNRADYTSVTNMLTNFFVSKGFKQSDAVAQAGLVLNLKQQGYSDADINTAIQTQQNTLNSIAANQAAQAAAALAAEQPKVAATLALSTAAKAGEGANYGGNTLITVNGVTETRDQAANFYDNSVGEMVANPNDPRGPLITRAQYDQIIASNKLATGSDTSLIATAPNVSKVVAINGVPVSSATDLTKSSSNGILGTTEPITDASKALATVVKQATTDLNKTTTPVTPSTPTPDTTKPADPLKQLTDFLSNLVSPVTKPASDAVTATEKTLSDAISATQKTIGDASTQAVTDVQKTFADTLTAAEKSAADLAASASQSASDAQKQTSDFLANADLTINGLISKLTGAVSTATDMTKTITPTPAPAPTPTPTPTPTPQPQATTTLTDKAKAFFQKYSTPIVLSIAGAGAIGSLAFVMSHNSKQGIIAR